jgi:hypothetical protein
LSFIFEPSASKTFGGGPVGFVAAGSVACRELLPDRNEKARRKTGAPFETVCPPKMRVTRIIPRAD